MALIKCPECGRDISDAAAACPNCGFPLDRLKTEGVRVVRTAVPAASAGETLLVVRRGFAFAAAILGTLALLLCGGFAIGHAGFLVGDWFSESMATGLYVQVVLLTIGTACCWVGVLSRMRGFVLGAGIFYSLALVSFLILGIPFVLLPMIFAYVGYSRMKPRRMTVEEYMLD